MSYSRLQYRDACLMASNAISDSGARPRFVCRTTPVALITRVSPVRLSRSKAACSLRSASRSNVAVVSSSKSFPALSESERMEARISVIAVLASAARCFDPTEFRRVCAVSVSNSSSTEGISRRVGLEAFVGLDMNCDDVLGLIPKHNAVLGPEQTLVFAPHE